MNSAQEQEGRSEACRQHLYGCNRCKKTIHICISLQPPLKQDAISSGGTTENGRADKERGEKKIRIDVLLLYLLSYRKQRQNTNQPTPCTDGWDPLRLLFYGWNKFSQWGMEGTVSVKKKKQPFWIFFSLVNSLHNRHVKGDATWLGGGGHSFPVIGRNVRIGSLRGKAFLERSVKWHVRNC